MAWNPQPLGTRRPKILTQRIRGIQENSSYTGPIGIRLLRAEEGFAHDLFNGRMAVENGQEARFPQRPHALLARRMAERFRRRVLHDKLLEPLGEEHHLEDRLPALVAGVVALRAPPATRAGRRSSR